MANTTETDVINCFHSLMMNRSALPASLEHQWFVMAVGRYELELKHIEYNTGLSAFTEELPMSVVVTLGYMIVLYYITRELSRIEKIQTFKGKDIEMTGVASSKQVTYNDLLAQKAIAEDYINKQKTAAYI